MKPFYSVRALECDYVFLAACSRLSMREIIRYCKTCCIFLTPAEIRDIATATRELKAYT